MADPNNLLVKYGVEVKGSTGRVDIEFRKKTNQVALVFTEVHTSDAMRVAVEKLSAAVPAHIKNTLSFGATGGEFTVQLPVGSYEQLTGQKFDRGAVPNL